MDSTRNRSFWGGPFSGEKREEREDREEKTEERRQRREDREEKTETTEKRGYRIYFSLNQSFRSRVKSLQKLDSHVVLVGCIAHLKAIEGELL